jgi:hypothetical protein
MGLITRLKSRLRGAPPVSRTLGERFTPADAEVWKELEEQVDAELKKAGSALVGAWEVGAAELGRVVMAQPDDKALIERFSDALVPTQQAFQDLHKGIPTAMAKGLRAGTTAGTFAAATVPLVELLAGLDTRAEAGWTKTTGHLGPLFALCKEPDAARAAFLAGGPALAQACRDADQVWRTKLAALPASPGLWEGMTGAAEGWQLAVTRGVEIAVVRHTKGLVAAIRAS